MESRHLSINNTIIDSRQLITSTIHVDTYIYIDYRQLITSTIHVDTYIYI